MATRTIRRLRDRRRPREAIKATVERGGRVLVPTFAIGRSQHLLYLLAGAFKRKTLKPFPIFLDSPMAIRATEVYRSLYRTVRRRGARHAPIR